LQLANQEDSHTWVMGKNLYSLCTKGRLNIIVNFFSVLYKFHYRYFINFASESVLCNT
jgi:hypothetical protein